ncbi:MAG: glycerol-3-phosphate dehydrogenase/oxidase [Planctomycetota bacterium]|jgi:glycerol-3-phosphate dehydrogenase
MNRDAMLERVRAETDPWDLLVVGGGATGAGTAVDAAARGYRTLLLEQSDFGKGTSSRSTKLVHGGVRYLQQGNISLVMEALKERGILRRNAPHLVSDLAFVVPNYDWWEAPFYGIGMKVYDLLAGKYGFGRSRLLSREDTVARIPNIETDGLRGGVLYYDGQFDDARLLVNLVTTAVEQGATVLNHVRVTGLERDANGVLNGVRATDVETGAELAIPARAVINATGPFADGVRRMNDPEAPAMIAPSQGAHVVLPGSFLRGDSAIMVPRTSDGRVLFAIPWHGLTLVGTTDIPIDDTPLEPRPLDEEIEFILETAVHYLETDPTRADVLSAFAGIRPLVKAAEGTSTAALSRDHTIQIDASGLLTVVGGKWTTYRKMAEDTVDHAATLAELDERPCVTRELNIHGCHRHPDRFGPLSPYGSDAPEVEAIIRAVPGGDARLHADLPARAGEVRWAVRREMARTVDDFLARRTRSLLFDARAAIEAAPAVAAIMADELGRDDAWRDAEVEAFTSIARGYVLD